MAQKIISEKSGLGRARPTIGSDRGKHDLTLLVRPHSAQAGEAPWRSPFGAPPPRGFVYGGGDCLDGYEGARAAGGGLASCHLRIYVPTWLERNAVALLSAGTLAGAAAAALYLLIRAALRRHTRRLKARRRARRHQRMTAHVQPSAPRRGSGGGSGGGGGGGGGGGDSGEEPSYDAAHRQRRDSISGAFAHPAGASLWGAMRRRIVPEVG